MRGNPTPGSPLQHCLSATGLALLTCVSLLPGLQLERVIPVTPTGTRGATLWPIHLVLNTMRNRLYVAGNDGWTAVVDCATNRIEREVPTPAVWLSAGGMTAWSESCRKAYFLTLPGLAVVDGDTDSIVALISMARLTARGRCVAFDDTNRCLLIVIAESSRVLVVDGSGDTLRREIRTPRQPLFLVWNPLSGRYNTLEVGVGDSCYMTVYDAATVTVLDSLALGATGPRALAYAAMSNKVYAGTRSAVVVVDGSSSRILKRFPFAASRLTYSRSGNRLYCCSRDTVRVVDCVQDSLLGFFTLPGFRGEIAGSCLTGSNRLWLAAGPTVFVADAGADSLLAVIALGSEGCTMLEYNRQEQCVYVATEYPPHVFVADESTGRLRDTIVTGVNIVDLCCNPKMGKIYARDIYGYDCESYVTAVSRETGEFLKRVRTGRSRYEDGSMALSPGQDKLYCPNGIDGTIAVVDCHSDTVVKTIAFAASPFTLVVNTTDSSLYCTHLCADPCVTVIDCRTDTLVAVIPLGCVAYDAWWHAGVNKLYAQYWGGGFAVIDCKTNRVIRELELPWTLALACHSKRNRLYLPIPFSGAGLGLLVLDAVGDTVVDSFPQLRNCGWAVCNEPSDKVFFTGSTPPPEDQFVIGVVDCARDSFTSCIAAPYHSPAEPAAISHPTSERVYFYTEGDQPCPGVTYQSGVRVIDCLSDSIVGIADYPLYDDYTSRLRIDPTRNLVFANGMSRVYVLSDPVPGIAESSGATRQARLSLSQNPMLNRLVIRLDLPAYRQAELRIHNRAGRLVRTLSWRGPGSGDRGPGPETRAPGPVLLTWDGRDDEGRQTPAGVYFVSVMAGNLRLSQKVIHLR